MYTCTSIHVYMEKRQFIYSLMNCLETVIVINNLLYIQDMYVCTCTCTLHVQ